MVCENDPCLLKAGYMRMLSKIMYYRFIPILIPAGLGKPYPSMTEVYPDRWLEFRRLTSYGATEHRLAAISDQDLSTVKGCALPDAHSVVQSVPTPIDQAESGWSLARSDGALPSGGPTITKRQAYSLPPAWPTGHSPRPGMCITARIHSNYYFTRVILRAWISLPFASSPYRYTPLGKALAFQCSRCTPGA